MKRPRGHRPREGAQIIQARLTNPFQSIRATAWLVVAAVLGSGAAAGGVFNDRFEAAIQGLDTTLDGQIDQVAVAGVIGPVQVVCDQAHAGQLIAGPTEWDWSFSYSALPEGMSADAAGLIEYTPACDGPETETLTAQASSSNGQTAPVDIHYHIHTDPPELAGLDLDGDGTVDNAATAGAFEQPLEVFCDDTVTFFIVADADTLSLGNPPAGMSLDGAQVSYVVPDCADPFSHSVTINAHRDELSDSATLSIEASPRPPGPEILGLDYLVDEGVDNPIEEGATDEVQYFCGTFARDTGIITEEDDVTFSIANDNPYVVIEEDTNLLRLGHPTYEECETLEGLVSTVRIRAEGADGGVTEFDVPIRGYRPQVKALYVEYGQKSDGTIQDPETVLFDENKFTEKVIELTCDLVTGAEHRLHLKPVISHEAISQFTPARNYTYEGQNEPFWSVVETPTGIVYARPGCDQLGPVLPRPSYTISSGPTDGPDAYKLRLTVTE